MAHSPADPASPLDAVLHPVRWRIVRELAGAALTTRDLQARVGGVPPATLYRHVQALADAGVIVVAAEQQIRGATERTYRLADDAAAAAGEGMGFEEQRRAVLFLLASVHRDVEEYLDGVPGELPAPPDGLTFTQTPMHFTPASRREFFARLEELIRPHLDPAAGDRVDMTMIQVPRGEA